MTDSLTSNSRTLTPESSFEGASDAATSAASALAVHGESDAAAARWIERRLVSPLYGALVHAAEGAVLLAEADVIAGRVYDAGDDRPCAYVSAPGLELSVRQRTRLQAWPLAEDSVFQRLAAVGVVDRPIPLGELFMMSDRVDDRQRGAGLSPMLHPACRVADAFVVTLAVQHRCWAALLLLRHRQRPRFDAPDRDAVMTRRSILSNVLRLGLTAQAPARPTARHDRLSRTERDVLRLLCEDKTERAVAEQLGRSPHTVHVHVKSIYRKLRVHSRQQLQRVMRELS